MGILLLGSTDYLKLYARLLWYSGTDAYVIKWKNTFLVDILLSTT